MCSLRTSLALIVLVLVVSLASAQVNPGKIHEIGKDGLAISGKLTRDDPPLASMGKAPHKVFQVKLEAGQPYVMTLQSSEFDAYLIVQDAKEKKLAADDDSG